MGIEYVLVVPEEGVFLLTDLDWASTVLFRPLALLCFSPLLNTWIILFVP